MDMDNEFLEGIDEHFQHLMKLHGNEKGNGHPMDRSKEDRLVAEIIEHLHSLSKAQKEEVLTFMRSLRKQKVG